MSLDSNNSKNMVNSKIAIQQQIPYMTRIRHHLALYHPILWWRVTYLKRRNMMIHWYLYDILLLLHCCKFETIVTRQRLLSKEKKSIQYGMAMWYYNTPDHWYIQPFVVYSYIGYKVSCTIYTVIKSIYEVQKSRMIAHIDAYQCLYERIHTQHRAYRTYAYDVYLPPLSSSSLSSNDVVEEKEVPIVTEFILFLPGAYVEHVAYAQIAALLSDYGYFVIVMSSEGSLGIVDMYIPQFSITTIQRIQKEIEMKHMNRNNHNCRWILMGHSMGSLTCTKLLQYLPNIKQVVLWGSAPFIDYMGHLSHRTSYDGLRILVVQGTNDDIIQKYCTPEMIQEYWNRLPSSPITTLYKIIGGTHHGFGNYIRNNNNNVKDDDDDDDWMPIQEQHAIAVKVTVDFLRNTKIT